MTLKTALRLGRVSNLPTVISNVLAGVALAGRHPAPLAIAAIAIAMSLFYVGGMFLNDAFDRDLDRVERPERPIPSGAVTAAVVFDAGFAMLAAAVAIVAVVAFATGATWRPVVLAGTLAALIILYDAHHKQSAIAPFVMGGCRACVYLVAGLAVRDDVCGELGFGALAIGAYVVGLTYIAKQENLREVKNLWPLVFLAVPFAGGWPDSTVTWALYVALASWVVRALGLLRARKIRDAVTGLIAGISLVDALWMAHMDRPALALIAIGCFVATTVFQRSVPGT